MDFSLLNDAQREAVTCIDAPSLVIAGAGSGKTRVLTYKIAYLLEQNYLPWNILALTFTNKAAREMQQRVAQMVDEQQANALWMGTFHSVFSRILRIEAQVLGFTSDYTIYDAADSKSLVKSIIREMGLDEKKYKPAAVCSRISEAKNRLIFPNQYQNTPGMAEQDASRQMPEIGNIYWHYMRRCRLSNAMDFDDLLLYTYYLFEKYPEVLKKYQERFHYVLVDDYQDTNYAQHRIVWQLTAQRQRVCVVGDDAQSIYSFRGANIDNILNFQKMYEGTRLFKLERNYRSTQNIVRAANSLIGHNRGQIHKESYSEKGEGALVQLMNVQSDYEESIVVSHRIQTLYGRDHIEYGQMAILYRTNAQSRSLEEQLRKLSIPYRIYGGLSFYQRKEIKDVIAYLRLAVNPRDEEALKRVVNYPARGIGDTTMQKVLQCATQHDVSPWQVLLSPENMGLAVNRGMAGRLQSFASLISSFHQKAETQDAYSLAKEICNASGVVADINKGKEADDVTRQENLEELMNGLSAYVEQAREEGNSVLLRDYLQSVSLLSDLDSEDTEEGNGTDNKVTLMTIHSAKGLEFRVVFVTGLEEDLFPNRMAMDEGQRGVEEERRLMYVAMTRAEEQLYLSTASNRYRFGTVEKSYPSRFLREIDQRYMNRGWDEHAAASSRQSYSSPDTGHSPFSSRLASSSPDTGRSPFSSRLASSSPDTGHSLFSSRRAGEIPATGKPVSSPQPQPGISTRNLPPSVWGKTLRKVAPASPETTKGSSPEATSLREGNVVNHSRFGQGTIVSLAGSGMDARVVVDFDNVGRKTLLLRYAKFTVVK